MLNIRLYAANILPSRLPIETIAPAPALSRAARPNNRYCEQRDALF